MLEQEVSQYLDDRVRDIGVVVRTAHITAFSRQVITVAHFVLISPTVVFVHSIRGRMGAVCIEALSIFVDGDKFLGLLAWGRQRGEEKLLRASDSRRARPKWLGRVFGGRRQLLIWSNVLLVTTVAKFADTLLTKN